MEKNKKSFALIMTLGIMAMLSILAIGFLSYIRIESKILINTYYKIAANYAAESGIEKTVAKLKAHALNRAYYSNAVNSLSATDTYESRNLQILYTVNTIDCASQIYLNDKDADLASILKYLPGINLSEAIAIKDKQPYKTKQELMGVSGIAEGTYGNIKNYLTVNSWTNKYVKNNTGNQVDNGRAPVNLNSVLSIGAYATTATDNNVIKAVLTPLLTDNNTTKADAFINDYLKNSHQVSCPTCNNTGKTINTSTHPTWFDKTLSGTCPGICAGDGAGNDGVGIPFKSWAEFNAVVDKAVADGTIDLSIIEGTRIKNSVNPNTTKPGNSTTELIFNSNGYFDISSTGTIESKNGIELASSSLNAIYHIFDIEHFTLKEQFENSDWDNFKVTTQDYCPTLTNESWTEKISATGIPSDTTYITDSIKLGYWEDFSDISNALSNWHGRLGTPTASTSTPVTLELIQEDSTTYTDLVGDSAAYNSPTNNHRGNYTFTTAEELDKWSFGEFFAHVWLYDSSPPWKDFPELPTYTPPYAWPDTAETVDGITYGNTEWDNYKENHRNPSKNLLNPDRELWNVGMVLFGVNPFNTYREDDANAAIRMKYEAILVGTSPTEKFFLYPAIQLDFPNTPTTQHNQSIDLEPFSKSNEPYLLTKGTTGRGKTFIFSVCKPIATSIKIGLRIDETEFHATGYYTGNAPTFSGINYANYQPGLFSINGECTGISADNIRIIPRSPYYIYNYDSSTYDSVNLTYAHLTSAYIPENMPDAEANSLIEGWGTIIGTVTIPATADKDSEFVFFRTNKNSLTGNSKTLNISPADGVITGTNSISRLQFQANFESNHTLYSTSTIDGCNYAALSGNTTINDNNFQETPVLEDITITYLPHEEITYWKKK